VSETVPPDAPAVAAQRAAFGRMEAQAWRYSGRIILGLVVAFVLAWVGYKASGSGQVFVLVGLNALTLAGLYFIVASGFSLIFGLMRVVNMAHGSFFMLGGFIAFELVRSFSGEGATSGFTSTASFGDWILGLVIASFVVGVIGLVMQQLFLRWNQGQELRQALITIAASIIIADQVLGHFGGIADEIPTPEQFPDTVSIGVYGISYPFFRIFVLAVAVFVGLLLLGMIKRTRLGMIIRAGVDDRPMVEALGINVPVVFAATFFLGSLLAGMAGVLGGTMISVDKANDVEYLLASLIVVIIGGMGSLGGAAVGALLYGLVDSYGDVYLPSGYENYSDLVIFALLVLVLAVRPHGLFGRPA
jgi:branched-chain amino acid transport system permease protein